MTQIITAKFARCACTRWLVCPVCRAWYSADHLGGLAVLCIFCRDAVIGEARKD